MGVDLLFGPSSGLGLGILFTTRIGKTRTGFRAGFCIENREVRVDF
jgi:hypothetical protein